MVDVLRRTASQVFIPLTVGGGLRTVEDMHRMLEAGADKVSINTAAVLNPGLITEGARRFGNQCIVLGMDAQRVAGSQPVCWEVFTHTGANGGRGTGLDAIEWAKKAVLLGAGEIVVNSIDADGTQGGYDLELLRAISESVPVPVVASGGAGKPEDLYRALVQGKADAVLAASIYHYGKYTIRETKDYLAGRGIPVRR
jgi:cyclase